MTSEHSATAGQQIDWPALSQRYRGRNAFIAKLLRSVRDASPTKVAELESAAQSADFDAIGFVSHSIKGIAGNLDAASLSELAHEVELAARNRDPGAIAQVDGLVKQLQSMLVEVEGWLAKEGGEVPQ